MSSVQEAKEVSTKIARKVQSAKKRYRMNKKREIITKSKALEYLEATTKKITRENESSDAEYSDLQYTWNRDILERTWSYIPKDADQLIGIGSFQGALEISLSHFFNIVTCVDHKSYLPLWKPRSVIFHKANIDSATWELPDTQYDICYFIETIEHLLWSPLPLLQWIKTHCKVAVISTPDDREWPAMDVHPWTRYQNYKSIPPASPGVKGNPLPMFHCKQYTPSEFIEMLEFSGFRIIEFFRVGEGKHQMAAVVEPRMD